MGPKFSGNGVMIGATVSTAGAAGLIPAPAAADYLKFFRGDGTWVTGAGTGDLLAANNLSDVASLTTSQGNLAAGAGSNSVRLGAGATAAGVNGVAVGSAATAAGDYSIAIGRNTSTAASPSAGAIAIGHNVLLVGDNTTAIGYQASAVGTVGVAIGSGAQSGSRAGSSNNVAVGDDAKIRDDLVGADLTGVVIIGRQASTQASGSIIIGASADISSAGTGSIAIGKDAQVTHASSWVVGTAAFSTANSQILFGSVGSPFTSILLGGGAAATAAPGAFDVNFTNATGTDISASDVTFYGQRSTGTGTGGRFLFYTAKAGSTGSSLNARDNRFTIESSNQIGARVALPESYASTGLTYGFEATNAAASSGIVVFTGDPSTRTGNLGLRGIANHSGINGANVGVLGQGSGSRVSVGVIGNASYVSPDDAAAISIGGAFFGLRGNASAIQIGVAGVLSATTPTFTSAAVLADNGATTSPIFVGRDNGSTVFTIADGGAVTMTAALTTATTVTSSRSVLQVTNVVTAAGTTTLTTTSTGVQIFTGSTTQDVTLPAANLDGAGYATQFILKNRSSGTVTINRAGADTIDGATSYSLLAGNSVMLISNGVSDWTVN